MIPMFVCPVLDGFTRAEFLTQVRLQPIAAMKSKAPPFKIEGRGSQI